VQLNLHGESTVVSCWIEPISICGSGEDQRFNVVLSIGGYICSHQSDTRHPSGMKELTPCNHDLSPLPDSRDCLDASNRFTPNGHL